MILETQVRMELEEREILRAAAAHLGIVYEVTEEDGRRAPEWRAVNAAGEGAPLGHETLHRALTGLMELQARCAVEAAVGYWESQLVPVAETDTLRIQPGRVPEGLPLVADPHQMCRVLAEAREQQFIHSTRAVNLLKRALRQCPKPRVEERLRDIA